MILITGGSGQIGSFLKFELLKYHSSNSIILAVKTDFAANKIVKLLWEICKI